MFYEKDEKRKAALREDLQKNYYPTALAKLNDIIAQNNGHLALGRVNISLITDKTLYSHLNVDNNL